MLLVSYFTMRRNRRKYNHRREALMHRRRVQKWRITNFLTREKTIHIIYIATYSMYVSCALNAKQSSRLCCCPPCRHILTCLQSRTRAVTPPSIRVEPTWLVRTTTRVDPGPMPNQIYANRTRVTSVRTYPVWTRVS